MGPHDSGPVWVAYSFTVRLLHPPLLTSYLAHPKNILRHPTGTCFLSTPFSTTSKTEIFCLPVGHVVEARHAKLVIVQLNYPHFVHQALQRLSK